MRSVRNEAHREELCSRVAKITGSESALWGKMNVNQMVSHLVQTAELPFEKSLPDKSNFFSRTLLKPLVLYVLPIPKEVKTGPELDQTQDGRKPLDLAADKDLVVEAIHRLAALPESERCEYHPFFGPMTPKQWGVLAHKHIDHHLKQFGV